MIEIPVWVIPLTAAVGAVLGAVVPLWIWRKSDRADRRRQTLQPLAATRDLIDRLPPDQWAINAKRESMKRWETVREQWLSRRADVVAVRSLYPDHENEVESLCTTVDNLIVEVGWMVRGVLEHSDFREWRDRALDSQATARNGVNALMRIAGKA